MVVSKIDMQQLSNLAARTGQDMEMSYGTLFLIAVMGVFYIAVSSVGIKTFNDCDQVQNSQKWKNLKMFLSHTMTAAIAMILTLLLTKIVKSEAAAFALLFGIFGIIASSMTLAMTMARARRAMDTAMALCPAQGHAYNCVSMGADVC